MKEFTALYAALDRTTKTNEKVAAMAAYFAVVDPADGAWAVALLTGRRPKRSVSSTRLQEWVAEAAGLPDWLLGECYDAVGDLAETIALVLPPPSEAATERSLAATMSDRIALLAKMTEEERKATILADWAALDAPGRFVYNKLITGSFRVGVSQELVVRALSAAKGVPAPQVTHRLMGDWTADAAFFEALGEKENTEDLSRPYPFMLAYALEGEPAALGDVSDWAFEWKWDGIRSQMIRRAGASYIWSRGEDLVTERFPEIRDLVDRLPDGTVLDGEILAWEGDHPLPFAALQKRIGRKTLTKKVLAEAPVRVVAYDLLEEDGEDLRERPFSERRARMEALLKRIQPSRELELDLDHPPETEGRILVADLLDPADWDAAAALRASAREHHVEGLMVKRRDAGYLVGRRKGSWWKWKIEPYTVDAVMVYAQRGSGKRASLYSDYTFALWKDGALVPFAKAYSGLTDEELGKVDAWVRRHTKESFGPVRTVEPLLVMELGFEGIQESARHKSGLAVRFPRILRWRLDKPPEEADSLETVRAMLQVRS